MNNYSKISASLVQRADGLNSEPGMAGTRLQLLQAAATFAIAAALQEIGLPLSALQQMAVDLKAETDAENKRHQTGQHK